MNLKNLLYPTFVLSMALGLTNPAFGRDDRPSELVSRESTTPFGGSGVIGCVRAGDHEASECKFEFQEEKGHKTTPVVVTTPMHESICENGGHVLARVTGSREQGGLFSEGRIVVEKMTLTESDSRLF